MVSLWPVPDTAVKLIMKALYSSLLQGARVSRALADAMTTVQTTKQFQHPANWAGFVLIGSDVKLSNKVAMMGQVMILLFCQIGHRLFFKHFRKKIKPEKTQRPKKLNDFSGQNSTNW